MEATEPLTEPESTPTPSWWRAVLAPWLLIHRPGKAAATMAAGPRSAVWVTLIAGVLLLAGVVLGATLWAGIATSEPVSPTSATGGWGWELRERSLGEAWDVWAGSSALLSILLLVLAVGIPFMLSVAVLTWLQLPLVHRFGSIAASFFRTLALGASGMGLALLLAAGFAALCIFRDNMWDRVDSQGGGAAYSYLFSVIALQAAFMAALLGLLGWCARARRSVRGTVELKPGPPLPWCADCRYDLTHVPEDGRCPECGQDIRMTMVAGPSARCAQCGYDLTHVPSDGRCPECGFAVERSLRPGVDRPGCAWQIWRGSRNWLAATFRVIVNPDRFYRRLRVWWPDEPARASARWQLVLMALLGTLWGVLCMLFTGGLPVWPAVPGYAVLWGVGIPLVGWIVHRVVGATVASWWLMRGTFPDFYPVWQVIRYETAYLWVFCVFNGALTTTMVMFGGSWMTDLWNGLFSTALVGETVEIIFMLCGNAALLLAWLWRYGRARRAVQWANF